MDFYIGSAIKKPAVSEQEARPLVDTTDSFMDYHSLIRPSTYFSSIVSQDETRIGEYIRGLYPDRMNMMDVYGIYLKEVKNSTESMFSFRDLNYCNSVSIAFIGMLSSCVKKEGGTYKDVLRILNRGKYIKKIPNIYFHCGKLSIGMLCKLMGIGINNNAEKMDCPRVWDLETDEVVMNPKFGNDPIHQIAAITHRWQSDEITYKDLMKLEQTNIILKELGKEPKSMQVSSMSLKLKRIREELKSQIRYVWMDTICIDKTSSTELDMSIRSMYRWYNNAAFVYLEGETNFKEWCTRGWTLQEGHAAKNLRVSPRHGNSFMELVSNMREYDVYKLALSQASEGLFSMYWIHLMESRKVTMVEDRVYALIGLLGIDFQIAYGEGNRSMSRICEEISRQKGDLTWLVDRFEVFGYDKMLHHIRLDPQEIQVTNLGIAVKAVRMSKKAAHDGIKVVNTYLNDDTYCKVEPDDVHYWVPASNMHVWLDKEGYIIYIHFYDFDDKLHGLPMHSVIIRHKFKSTNRFMKKTETNTTLFKRMFL